MDEALAGVHRFGPKRGVFAVGALLAAGAVIALLVDRNSVDRVVAVVVLLIVASTMFAAYRMRVRLQASTDGLLVSTLAGPRPISWAEVRRIEVVTRQRLGARSTTLEIDLDDDELLVFGKVDLGTDPADVADVLAGLRTGRR